MGNVEHCHESGLPVSWRGGRCLVHGDRIAPCWTNEDCTRLGVRQLAWMTAQMEQGVNKVKMRLCNLMLERFAELALQHGYAFGSEPDGANHFTATFVRMASIL